MADPSHGNPFSRRRRQNTQDGSAPGARPPRFYRGAHYSGTSSPADLTGRVAGIDLPHPFREYDPIRAEYFESPGYEAPEPEELFVPTHRTPPLRLDWPERPPPGPPSLQQSLAFSRVIDAVIQDVRDLREAGAPVPEHLAALYESAMGPTPMSADPHAAGAAPFMNMTGSIPNIISDLPPDPSMERLAIEMTTMPVEELMIDRLQGMPGFESHAAAPELDVDPMEMNLFGMAEGMMPEPGLPSSLEAPMLELPDPIGDSPAMTLDALVEQMMPEPAPPPEMPDPFALMQNQFNQQMQMMDPFNMMGPMM